MLVVDIMTPSAITPSTQAALAIVEARQLAASGAGRMIREAASLSLAEVGRAVGVDRTSVFYWETGAKRPSGDNAVRYRDFLAEVRSAYAANGRSRVA